jgi:hypothetical protein
MGLLTILALMEKPLRRARATNLSTLPIFRGRRLICSSRSQTGSSGAELLNQEELFCLPTGNISTPAPLPARRDAAVGTDRGRRRSITTCSFRTEVEYN